MEQKSRFSEIIFEKISSIKEKALWDLVIHFQLIEIEIDKKVDRTVWYVHDWRTRRLWTPLGDIVIGRTIYRSKLRKENGEYRYKIFFDEEMGLESHSYIQQDFWPNILSCLSSVKSYKALSKIFGEDFSSSTISKMINEQEMFFQVKKYSNSISELFICIDGIFVNQHKNKRYEIKCMTAFTKSTQGKRNKLENKVILPFDSDLSTQDIAWLLQIYIEAIYGDVKTIYIIGDGASWIDGVAKEFPNAKRFIDKFHFKKWIKDLVGRKVRIDWDFVLKSSKQDLTNYLSMLVANTETGEITEANLKVIRRIAKFQLLYKECNSYGLINVAECTQSHHIASHLKNRRAFSKEVALKILMINIAEFNGWQITTDSSKGINVENFSDPSAKMDISIRQSSMTNVPNVNHSSSNTATMFRAMCHGKCF